MGYLFGMTYIFVYGKHFVHCVMHSETQFVALKNFKQLRYLIYFYTLSNLRINAIFNKDTFTRNLQSTLLISRLRIKKIGKSVNCFGFYCLKPVPTLIFIQCFFLILVLFLLLLLLLLSILIKLPISNIE